MKATVLFQCFSKTQPFNPSSSCRSQWTFSEPSHQVRTLSLTLRRMNQLWKPPGHTYRYIYILMFLYTNTLTHILTPWGEKSWVPFRRELYTASSFEGRFGNASSVTGYLKHDWKHPMHLALAGGRLWRKLMSVCEHKGHPVEHIILFFPSGDLVSEVWVEICLLRNALGGVSIRVSVVWH